MCELDKESGDHSRALSELEALLEYKFKDPSLLSKAVTHRSFANEHENDGVHNNESLEFLGDAVLGFAISAGIFNKFPDLNEGELSKIRAFLVSAVNLALLAGNIHLGTYLLLSRGEEKTGGRKKKALLVDAYEAIIGAIYLDGGIDVALGFVERQFGGKIDELNLSQLTYGDYKSALQEQLHNQGRSEPSYRVVGEIGPDHKKTFIVQVIVEDKVIAQASGNTKKEAQQAAARLALEELSS